MMREEFESRTNFEVTEREYERIEKKYMSKEFGHYDKDEFCKLWLEQGGIREVLKARANGDIDLPPIRRYTIGELFLLIVDRLKKSGEFEKAGKILNYYLPNKTESLNDRKVTLTNYEFNIVTHADFGGSEGIYLDCSLRGTFDDSGNSFMKFGSFKTLKTDLESMKIMAELGGILNFRTTEFVNENIVTVKPPVTYATGSVYGRIKIAG